MSELDNNNARSPDPDDEQHDCRDVERERLNPTSWPTNRLPRVIITPSCNGSDGGGAGAAAGDGDDQEPIPSSTSTDHVQRPARPPDGGLYAWLVCLAAFWTNGAIFGVINSEGVLHVRLLDMYGGGEDGQDSSFKISLVGSLSIGTTFLLSPIAAILTDSFGIRQTAFVGSILVVVGMFLSSFVTSLSMLYLTYGLMLGVGASLAYTPSLVILGHYFKRRLGFVNGVATAGSSVFTMILPFVIKAMLDSVQLSGTFMLLSAMVVLLLPCALLFRPLQIRAEADVEEVPAAAAVISRRTLDNRWRWKKFIDRFVNTSIWHNRKYMVWAMAFPVSLFGYFVPYVHLINHVKVILPGYSGEALITCIAAASMVGRIAFGQLADFRGVSRIQLQQLSFFSLGVLTMLLSVADQYWILIVICLGLGIFDGCFISLLGPIAFEIVGNKGAPQAIGFLLGICSVPLTLGPPIAGWLYDRTGKSYEVAFLAAGIPPIIGSLLMFVISRVPQPALPNQEAVINGDNKESAPIDETSKLTHSVSKDISEECRSEDENSVWKRHEAMEKNGHDRHANGTDNGVGVESPAMLCDVDNSAQVALNNQKNAAGSIITERESAF